MAFDNTKYDIELNSVPYRIDGYQKSDFSPFLPRFTAGETAESEFDLLKSSSIKSFSGGSLQRYSEDETSVFQAKSLFPVYDDGTLYPVSHFTEAKELFTTTKSKITAVYHGTRCIIVAYKLYNSTNAMKRYNNDGTSSSISLPSNMSNSARSIVSIIRAAETSTFYVTCSDGLTMGYLDNAADTSVAEIGSGTSTACISQAIIFRGQLYGMDGTTGDESNYALYRHTGGTSSRARVKVGITEGRFFDNDAKILLYNNRIILMRNNGMWAYDGVQFVNIEYTGFQVNDRNYRFPFVLRGYLYYFMPDGMYRFNGSTIEKLYDISEIGYPVAATTGGNRAWIAFSNSSAVQSSRYDKAVGFDHSSGNTVDARVMCFDGKGMFEYARTPTWTQSSPDFTGQGEVSDLIWFSDKLFAFSNYDKIGSGGSGTNRYYHLPTNETVANSGDKAWQLITSIFDGGYSMISKNLENLEIVLDGYVPSDQTITISYRKDGFDGSTNFTTLGTFSTQSELKREVWKTLGSSLSFDQIQFKLTGTTDVRTGIRRLIIRYTLAPKTKWQWQFTAKCYGDNPIESLILKDKSLSDQAVSLLRGNIYSARTSDQPVGFVDVDQYDLSGAHNSSTTTITLNSTDMLKNEGFIKIGNEIIAYTGKTSTTLTGCTRGVLGTTAAAHDDNAKVFAYYRVFVRQISNERIEMTDNNQDATENKSHPSDITLVLQEA